MSKWIPQVK